MMNPAASRSSAISSSAPIVKTRRIPDGTPASVAFVEGLRSSWRSTTPPTPAPTSDAVIIDPVRPAVAVNATIEARIDSVAEGNPANQRGTADIEASGAATKGRQGFARRGGILLPTPREFDVTRGPSGATFTARFPTL